MRTSCWGLVGLSLAFSAGPGPAVAQVADPVSLTACAPASLRLRAANPAELPSRVEVVRVSTGQTLFTDAYRAPAYGHRFDFAGVPAGRYLVHLRQGRARYGFRVQVDARGTVLSVDPVGRRPDLARR